MERCYEQRPEKVKHGSPWAWRTVSRLDLRLLNGFLFALSTWLQAGGSVIMPMFLIGLLALIPFWGREQFRVKVRLLALDPVLIP
jgi:hypothetical protein